MSLRAGIRKCGWRGLADVDFKLNLKGLNEVMKSSEMKALLDSTANQIAENAQASASKNIKGASEGYTVEAAHDIKFISIASVRTTNFAARLDNSRHNTLEKAIGGVQI